ncbi:MAG: aspartate aminotransferase family protein [Armatimonadetes bacterium]|nr:aspartate aminotransferase family protein [Armatimonadota bacterium]
MDADQFHAKVVEQYHQYVNPYLAKLMNFAGFGVEVEGEGCYVIDHEGRRYLDFLGGYGVFSLGHRHPRVVDAVHKQLDKMPLSSKVFFSPVMAELAERLGNLAPGQLQFTFFSNSGTEAVEAAMKLAKGATGRTDIVSTVGGYHGKTLGALSITGREKYRLPFEPLLPGPNFVPFGDADALDKAITTNTAAFIVEAVQGEGGIHVAPPGYLKRAQELCRKHGALFIMDEVQTGLGRTGKMFACEHEGVEPDLMTLAKCLGGGVMPIGATLGTAEVWEKTFGKNPLIHTSTFGGNPIACAAGIAALDVIEEEGLIERSRELGSYLFERLRSLAQARPALVNQVRGMGLMVGVEFAYDEVGELTIAQLTKRGVIAAYTLNNPRVIRMEPPLVVTREQIDSALEAFDGALAETEALLTELGALEGFGQESNSMV